MDTPIMIDPREFGRLEAQVEMLTTQVSEMSAKIDVLVEALNKSKGGFWTMMTAGAAVSAVVGWFVAVWTNQ